MRNLNEEFEKVIEFVKKTAPEHYLQVMIW